MYAKVMKMVRKVQNTGSDQFLIFRPSSGPNGSMLNAPKMAFADNHSPVTRPMYGSPANRA